MRDESIIRGFDDLNKRFQQVIQHVQNLEQSVRLAFTGETVRSEAIQALLLRKEVVTEVDASLMISKLVSFLSTKVSITEEEKYTLETELRFALNSTKEPFITQEELTQSIGDTIQKMQQQAEEATKKAETPEIITPTPEQVQQVTNTSVEAPIVTSEVTPPQA